MGLLWLIFLALLAFVAIRFIRHYEGRTRGDPLDIVKQRYAKGEINKEQFEQLKKDLK